MTDLNITFTCSDDDSFPIYRQYGGQYSPQPSYISLDIEDGECTADYSGEIGNAIPFSVWHKRVLRFSVAPCIRAAKLLELIESNKEDFQAILNGASVEWDGSNNVGRFTDEAERIIERLEETLLDESNQFEVNIISDSDELYNYLSGDIYPVQQDVADFADEIIADVDAEYYALSSDMNHTDGMLSYLSDIWANELYNGKELPQEIAQCLVEQGTCDNSAWTEELAAMANGTYNEEDF